MPEDYEARYKECREALAEIRRRIWKKSPDLRARVHMFGLIRMAIGDYGLPDDAYAPGEKRDGS